MPRSRNIAIVILLVLILTVTSGRTVHHRIDEINWTPEMKQKLFKILQTSVNYRKDYEYQIKREWNECNPFHQVLDHNALYDKALSVVDEKCREWERLTRVKREQSGKLISDIHDKIAAGKPGEVHLMHNELRKDHPEFHDLGEDLTWSLVYNWYRCNSKHAAIRRGKVKWTRDMKVDLLYIHKRARYREGRLQENLKTEWMLLHPDLNIMTGSLYQFIQELKKEEFQPTEKEWQEAKKRYDEALASRENTDEQLDEEEPTIASKKRYSKWDSRLKTDLLYVASRIAAERRTMVGTLKESWDRMNCNYNFLTYKALIKRLQRLEQERFNPNAEDWKSAEMRYNNPRPISSCKRNAEGSRRKDKMPIPSEQPHPQKQQIISHNSTELTAILKHLQPPSSTERQNRFPIADRSQNLHTPRGKIPSSQQYNRHELHQQFLDRPIYSPPRYSEFLHSSDYETYHHQNVSDIDTPGPSSFPDYTHSDHQSGDRIETSQESHRKKLKEHLSDPTHFPPLYSNILNPSEYDKHYHENVNSIDTPGPSSLPGYTHSDHQSGVWTSLPHDSPQHDLHRQGLDAPIYSPTYFRDFSYPPEYDFPYSPSNPYSYDPNLHGQANSSHNPPSPSEYGLQHPPYHSPFDPYSHDPNLHGKGSSSHNQSQHPPQP